MDTEAIVDKLLKGYSEVVDKYGNFKTVPVTEMALVEKTNKQRIYKSIRLGIKKIRKLFKKN